VNGWGDGEGFGEEIEGLTYPLQPREPRSLSKTREYSYLLRETGSIAILPIRLT
jgi:hypothetical protein